MSFFLPCVCVLVQPAVACEPSTAADQQAAKTFYRAGKWDEARLEYEKITPSLEGDELAAALVRLGYCWQRLHKHADAIPIFRRALEVEGASDTQVCLAKLKLGYSLRLNKQSDEAIRILDEASSMRGVPTNLTAETLLNAAWELNTRGRADEALARFRKIETINDVHQNYIAAAYLNIGRVHQDRKEYRNALQFYRKVDSLKVVAATNRARARVYALECESLLAGDQAFHIRPYATKVSTNAAVIQWVSQGESAPGMVSVFLDGTKQTEPPLVASITVDDVSTASLQDTICHLHSASIKGLRPQTRYRYTATVGGDVESGSFRTPPKSDQGAGYSFCLIGDTQSYHSGLQPLLDAMGDERTDFVLHVGDVTDRGNMWGEWKAGFFDPGHKYLSRSTFWPAYGNHDGGPYFPALFGLRPQLYYSFDWGDVHFVVLDSYGAGTGKIGRPQQLKWLEEDLRKNTKKWTIAAMHVPMIATRTGLNSFGTDDFLPLLEEYGVDIVFSGHHPLYRRYYPLGSKGKRPILHITSGGGGGPVGGYMPSPVLSKGINLNHYCRIDVQSDRLTLVAKTASGTVIDEVEVKKTSEAPEASVDTAEALRINSLYQELLTDRTFELRLTARDKPVAGKTVSLVLDLDKLPRGRLDKSRLPKDAQLFLSPVKRDPWQFDGVTASLQGNRIMVKALAPSSVVVSGGSLTPNARIRLQLKTGDRLFEPFEATARIAIGE